jgi:cardiolipin synthase
VATASAPVPALAWLPNGLTILRFLMIPAFIAVYAAADNGHSWTAGIIFGAAGITDQVDGWLARRWHVESEFGKFADPLADRLMIDTAVVMLVLADRLPWPALAVIVARDAFLIVGAKVVMPRGYEFSVSLLGKTATWLLYAGIGFLLVTVPGTDWPLWLFWIGLGTAVGAALLYVSSAWSAIRHKETA